MVYDCGNKWGEGNMPPSSYFIRLIIQAMLLNNSGYFFPLKIVWVNQ